MEEFYLLQARYDLNEDEEQSVAHYVAGLREAIHTLSIPKSQDSAAMGSGAP